MRRALAPEGPIISPLKKWILEIYLGADGVLLGSGLLGLGLGGALLVWQHRLLRPSDLSRIQAAFFTANGAIAIVLFLTACLDLYVVSPLR